MNTVAKELKIPKTTLSLWKASEWWNKTMHEVYEQAGERILQNNLHIATNAQVAILDRIEHGDVSMVANPAYDKTQPADDVSNPTHVQVRTPTKMRDLGIVTGITQDKARTALYGLDKRSVASSDQIEGLIRKFQAISQAHSDQLEKAVVSEQ